MLQFALPHLDGYIYLAHNAQRSLEGFKLLFLKVFCRYWKRWVKFQRELSNLFQSRLLTGYSAQRGWVCHLLGYAWSVRVLTQA